MRHIYGRNHQSGPVAYPSPWKDQELYHDIPWYTHFWRKTKMFWSTKSSLKLPKSQLFSLSTSHHGDWWHLAETCRNYLCVGPASRISGGRFLQRWSPSCVSSRESSGKHVKTRRSEVPIPMIVAWLKNWLNWIPSPKILSLESKNPSTGYFLPKST